MNADRNWERNEPTERDSRGGPQGGFQFSDAYGPGGGAAGNRVINDIHCKNATFDQQGFPDSSQLLPQDRGAENGEGGGEPGNDHGRGYGRGSGGRGDESGPGGRFDERDGGGPGDQGGNGQWEHGVPGQWEHGGHGGKGRGGHGGHRGHHGQEDLPPQQFDANGQPIPVDANGNPIPPPISQQAASYSPSYNGQSQPIDYSAASAPVDNSASQTLDSSAAGADPLIAQLAASNPDVAKVLTDAQTQMSPQGYAALSQLMQTNLSSGSDGSTALTSSISQLQQVGGPNFATDVTALQSVVGTDAPNLLPAASTSDAFATPTTTSASDSTLGTATDTSGTQSFATSGASQTSDTTLAQISQADPTMGQFVGALQQAGITPSTYTSIENTVAQNLTNGVNDSSTLQQLMTSLQQNPSLQSDLTIFQNVVGSFQQASSSTDSSGTTSDATAQSSSSDPNAQYSSATSGYSTPTSAAV